MTQVGFPGEGEISDIFIKYMFHQNHEAPQVIVPTCSQLWPAPLSNYYTTQ